jgi:hypothetical protein
MSTNRRRVRVVVVAVRIDNLFERVLPEPVIECRDSWLKPR